MIEADELEQEEAVQNHVQGDPVETGAVQDEEERKKDKAKYLG